MDMESLINKSQKDYSLFYALLFAVLTTLFLFFIDEGYYNFNWTEDWGNWVAFGIYVFGLFLAQMIVRAFLFKGKQGFGKSVLIAAVGIPIGIALVISAILYL